MWNGDSDSLLKRCVEIRIYEERKPNGQWLKSIRFKLPIIENDLRISLDNDKHVEMVCLLELIK